MKMKENSLNQKYVCKILTGSERTMYVGEEHFPLFIFCVVSLHITSAVKLSAGQVIISLIIVSISPLFLVGYHDASSISNNNSY